MIRVYHIYEKSTIAYNEFSLIIYNSAYILKNKNIRKFKKKRKF